MCELLEFVGCAALAWKPARAEIRNGRLTRARSTCRCTRTVGDRVLSTSQSRRARSQNTRAIFQICNFLSLLPQNGAKKYAFLMPFRAKFSCGRIVKLMGMKPVKRKITFFRKKTVLYFERCGLTQEIVAVDQF
jgi:hypothetical protein